MDFCFDKFLQVVLLLVVCAVYVRSDENCNSCVDQGKMWVHLPNCRVECVDKVSDTSKINSLAYRWIAQDSSQCYSQPPQCESIGPVGDENYKSWFDKNSELAQSPIYDYVYDSANPTSEFNKMVPVTGSRFLFFAGFQVRTYQHAITNVLIKSSSTHIAFFACRYVEPRKGHIFMVSVDDDVLFYMDYDAMKLFPEKLYKNIEVDVRKYADGKTHKIVFAFYDESPTAYFFVDNIRFIKSSLERNYAQDIAFPTYDFCGGGCTMQVLNNASDHSCHAYCNILSCNYDNGRCEKPQIIGKISSCYNGDTAVYDDNLDICPQYKSKSCCTNMNDVRAIAEKVKQHNKCKVETDCLKYIETAYCAYCSPNSNTFVRNGTIHFCMNFSDAFYSACKSSTFLKDDKCLSLADVYPSPVFFMDAFGLLANDDYYCFDYRLDSEGLAPWELSLIIIFLLLAIAAAVLVTVFLCYRKKKDNEEIELPNLKSDKLSLDAEPLEDEETKDDGDDDDDNYSRALPKLQRFKFRAPNLSLTDEWAVLLARMRKYEWDRSPVRMFPLTKKNEAVAEELISSRTCKIKEFESKLLADKSSAAAYNLHFGLPGVQVPVDQDLKQKVILVASDSQKTSFVIPKRKYPKFRFSAKPSKGTLSKGAMEIELTLRVTCTTSVQVQVPIIFWLGHTKDFEKAVKTLVTNKNSYVCFFRGVIQSKLSRRLDIEELELLRPPIGSGAFGTVYRGVYRNQAIACKLLKNQDDLTEDMLNDFRTEVDLFDQFRHPCIVTFIGAVWFPGSLAIVTELCKYGSLPSSMEKNPEAWDPLLKMKAMYDCACAMNYLHESSVMHRDLKPDNLLVTSLNRSKIVCKLSDFGTTKDVAGNMMGDMTQTKGIGTPFFMAPEVMRGGGHYTTQADVFSFGILMASVIDGEQPYLGDTRFNSSWEFTNKVINEGLRPTVKNASSMPPQLIQLMQLCWDGDPDKRPTFGVIVQQICFLFNALSAN